MRFCWFRFRRHRWRASKVVDGYVYVEVCAECGASWPVCRPARLGEH